MQTLPQNRQYRVALEVSRSELVPNRMLKNSAELLSMSSHFQQKLVSQFVAFRLLIPTRSENSVEHLLSTFKLGVIRNEHLESTSTRRSLRHRVLRGRRFDERM